MALYPADFGSAVPLRRHAALAARIEVALARLNEESVVTGDGIDACAPRALPPVACPPEIAGALTASPDGPTLGETPHDGARV